MAPAAGERTLEQTPTWAVAVVCFVLVFISIIIEHIFHLIGKWLNKKHKRALYESLEKIKSELMLLGFLSLLLTVGQGPISSFCISEKVAATWHPCSKKQESKYAANGQRKLYDIPDFDENPRRSLASAKDDTCASKGKVPFVSTYGIHQLHIFIFVLAVFHVLYCIITLALGRLKMKSWKAWEKETETVDYKFTNDPERFRFARETSFGQRHMSFWSHSSILLWIVCFFRQFYNSVPKVDYLTLRHGFITAHLAPQSQNSFDFQKYINRSLEQDFKVVVGINPIIWFFAVVFILFNTHGWYAYLWLPFVPLIIVLLVGTKLQVIITKMALTIQERGGVIKGTPVVKPSDELFWFNNPRLILYLINFVLFQNAFQLAFFVWSWYEFTLKSCFHEKLEDVLIRVSMGILVQILCSYVTLPLYALVTQMGSSMRPTVFNDKVATALRSWHHNAKKHVKHSNHSGTVTPLTSRPGTPLHGTSPLHLLHNHPNEYDSTRTSPRTSNFDEGSTLHHDDIPWANQRRSADLEEKDRETLEQSSTHNESLHNPVRTQHEITIGSTDFSFDKRPRT